MVFIVVVCIYVFLFRSVYKSLCSVGFTVNNDDYVRTIATLSPLDASRGERCQVLL